ncbi:MAG: endo-1,4-beta-xylanase [Balneolaceae bacterium]
MDTMNREQTETLNKPATDYNHAAFTGLLLSAILLLSGCGLTGNEGDESPEASDKFFGNVWSSPQIEHFTQYWNQVTPENAGKWGPLEPARGEYNWSNLDAAYALAKDNGFPFRFHVLVWGNQQPRWISELPQEEQLQAIHDRMAAISGRYPDMEYVEVVNEPLHDPPLKQDEDDHTAGDYYEALGGAGETGWDWVINSFEMARTYFPDAQLVLNDYSIVNTEQSTTDYLEIIALLQEQDLIDVIGIQGHAFSNRADTAITRMNLDRLAATGLPIQVTEFEIDGPDDEEQLAEYRRIFPTFWDHPAVIGITFWGWRPGMWRTQQGAYLVNQEGEHRPAFDWLLDYVENNP